MQPETTLPEVARQVLGQRGAAAEVLFLRTPQLLTRAGANTTDMLSRRLDQVTPRVAPGGVLAVETRDVRIDGGLQPLGLEVYRALRRRRGMLLKEIIAVVPAEDRRPPTQTTEPLAITHRYLLVALRDHSASTP